MKKKYSIVFVILLFSIFNIINVKAYNGYHVFTQYFDAAGVTVAKSPAREGVDHDERNVGVISKTNQARTSNGTNPHQGTDFNMAAGEEVYPIMGGEVVEVNTTLQSSQNAYVIIKTTINNVDYYTKYQHIIPQSLPVGSIIGDNTKIGTISYYIQYPPTYIFDVRNMLTRIDALLDYASSSSKIFIIIWVEIWMFLQMAILLIVLFLSLHIFGQIPLRIQMEKDFIVENYQFIIK